MISKIANHQICNMLNSYIPSSSTAMWGIFLRSAFGNVCHIHSFAVFFIFLLIIIFRVSSISFTCFLSKVFLYFPRAANALQRSRHSSPETQWRCAEAGIFKNSIIIFLCSRIREQGYRVQDDRVSRVTWVPGWSAMIIYEQPLIALWCPSNVQKETHLIHNQIQKRRCGNNQNFC